MSKTLLLTTARYSLAVCLVAIAIAASAQEVLPCGTVTPDGYRAPHQLRPAAFQAFKAAFAKTVAARRAGSANVSDSITTDTFPVNAYLFRRNDGSGGLTLSELGAAMQKVNLDYAGAGLAFELCNVQEVNSTRYFDFYNSDESDLRRDYYYPEGLNIYFANTVRSSSGGSLCGYAYYPYFGRNVVMMANNCATNGSTLSHEIGHAYGLPHTHGFRNGELTDELVDGSNCATAGDEFCDTPADPQLSTTSVTRDCSYVGEEVDSTGAAFTPDVSNFMSYSRKECRDKFSIEQLAAMKFNSQDAFDRVAITCDDLTADFRQVLDAGADFCTGGLTVTLAATGFGVDSYAWDVYDDGVVDGTSDTLTFTFPEAGSYAVSLRAAGPGGSVTRAKANFAVVGAAALPITQPFERLTFIDDYFWRYGEGAASWVLQEGETPSARTGPIGGRLNDDGQLSEYLYLEVSGIREGEEGIYRSGCIQLPSIDSTVDGDSLRLQTPRLTFYSHMFGSRIGALHVDLVTESGLVRDILPALIGQRQLSEDEDFEMHSVDLSEYAGQTVQVVFRGTVGSGFDGDIAIDDVSVEMITQTLVGVSGEVQLVERMRLSPNPATDLVRVQLDARGSVIYFVNALGQTVLSQTNDQELLDIRRLPPGYYSVVAQTPSGKTQVAPLVIER